MKILVLGAAGMAGHTISLYFKEQGYDVIGYSRAPIDFCHNIVGDAYDVESLKTILLNNEFDVVINCIGLLNQFAESNPSKAIFLNSFLPHFIVETLRGKYTKFIHMSTDCVFAGNTGPYTEKSFKDGYTFYDRSKALGEIDIPKHLTFRNSIIGPDMNADGIGLFNWFMKQSSTIKGYTGAIWTGVTTLTLAKAMEQAIKEDLSGLYNLVNGSNISKYDLLSLFNKYFKNNILNIERDNEFTLDKTLISLREGDFSFKVPSYETMVSEMKIWIDEHKTLYPFYYK